MWKTSEWHTNKTWQTYANFCIRRTQTSKNVKIRNKNWKISSIKVESFAGKYHYSIILRWGGLNQQQSWDWYKHGISTAEIYRLFSLHGGLTWWKPTEKMWYPGNSDQIQEHQEAEDSQRRHLTAVEISHGVGVEGMISNWKGEEWNIRQDQEEEWLVSVGIAHQFLASSNQPPPHDEIQASIFGGLSLNKRFQRIDWHLVQPFQKQQEQGWIMA